jgi:hypothetical protein
LTAATDVTETVLHEFIAIQLKKIPLAGNTGGRRISGISEDLCDQLSDYLNTSCFALQGDEATEVVIDAHLITSVWYVLENDIKEDILFCKGTDGRATSLEVFNTINHFLGKNGINWENCTGLCTDRAQSVSGQNAGFQELLKKEILSS